MRLTSYTVVATDGPIGTVEESTEELRSTYVVVDTGPWISGRHVLPPAGTVVRVDRDGEKLIVNRTRDEIRDAPAYDAIRSARPRARRRTTPPRHQVPADAARDPSSPHSRTFPQARTLPRACEVAADGGTRRVSGPSGAVALTPCPADGTLAGSGRTRGGRPG